MFVFTRNVFLYAFEKDFYSAAHSHNARFAPLWPAGHGSRSGGKRSTLVPCSVTRAQTDVTDALGRTRESPRGRSARCGALITAHADVISWRARGHCLNRMEGKLGERESFEGKDRGLIPCSTMPCVELLSVGVRTTLGVSDDRDARERSNRAEKRDLGRERQKAPVPVMP